MRRARPGGKVLLAGRGLDDDAVGALADAWSHGTPPPDGFASVLLAASSSPVVSLNLNGNAIGDAGVVALVRAIGMVYAGGVGGAGGLGQLQRLDLAGNAIGGLGIESLLGLVEAGDASECGAERGAAADGGADSGAGSGAGSGSIIA